MSVNAVVDTWELTGRLLVQQDFSDLPTPDDLDYGEMNPVNTADRVFKTDLRHEGITVTFVAASPADHIEAMQVRKPVDNLDSVNSPVKLLGVLGTMLFPTLDSDVLAAFNADAVPALAAVSDIEDEVDVGDYFVLRWRIDVDGHPDQLIWTYTRIGEPVPAELDRL